VLVSQRTDLEWQQPSRTEVQTELVHPTPRYTRSQQQACTTTHVEHTYAQISSVNLYYITPTFFGVNTPYSGSLQFVLASYELLK